MADKHRKALKEKLFVQIVEVDKTPAFVDITSSLGKPVEFSNPLATCSVRVTSDAVLFSTLKLSKRSRETLTSKPLAMPSGPLARLERKLDTHSESFKEGEITALLSVDDQEYVSTFKLNIDDVGVTNLDANDATETTVDADVTVFELPRTAISLIIFLPGVKGRTIAVSWVGYLNKPGTKETLTRAVAQALNHLSGLTYFRILTNIVTVKVPTPPGKFTVATPTRAKTDKVTVNVPVHLWPADGGPQLATGSVAVEVDLDDANPATNRLLLHTSADPKIADLFEHYRAAFDRSVHDEIVTAYGVDEIDDLVCDIVLGDLSSGQLERLKAAPERLTAGLHLSPKQGMLIAAS